MPVSSDAVAVGVGFGEVVAGVKEEDGDVGAELASEPKEENVFGLPGKDAGPYDLTISLHEAKLMLDIAGADGEQKAVHILSLSPLRGILRDYFMVCESYYDAIRTQTAAQIEAIDMGRRGLHNEGADLLKERLAGKIDCDVDTARRLFTLITALHWKG